MIARIILDQRQRQFQRRQQTGQRKRIRSGVKNIEGRIRNKTFTIKQLIAVPKNVQLKKTRQVVRRIKVHRKAVFLAERQRVNINSKNKQSTSYML